MAVLVLDLLDVPKPVTFPVTIDCVGTGKLVYIVDDCATATDEGDELAVLVEGQEGPTVLNAAMFAELAPAPASKLTSIRRSRVSEASTMLVS